MLLFKNKFLRFLFCTYCICLTNFIFSENLKNAEFSIFERLNKESFEKLNTDIEKKVKSEDFLDAFLGWVNRVCYGCQMTEKEGKDIKEKVLYEYRSDGPLQGLQKILWDEIFEKKSLKNLTKDNFKKDNSELVQKLSYLEEKSLDILLEIIFDESHATNKIGFGMDQIKLEDYFVK
ncbi:hypothetical protein K9M16_03780 [Candidatus Babeliales bacterium]|nr:hypothetical protein [Candidatus Babeliales bacterium]